VVNWLKGDMTLVQKDGTTVTRRSMNARPGILGKAIKISLGRREDIFKDKGRRGVIMSAVRRGDIVIIGKMGAIKITRERDTCKTGEETVALKNMQGCGKMVVTCESMVVSKRGQTVGTMSTMVMTGAEALGAEEVPVVTVLAVLHRSNVGVLDKDGILDLEMEQTLWREQPTMTDR